MAARPDDPAMGRSRRSVERAIADIRRGWPALILDNATGRKGLLAASPETANAPILEGMRDWCGPLMLLITARRAAVLHIPLIDDAVAALEIEADRVWEVYRDLADATKDLDEILRGPFRSATPPAGSAAALLLAKHARLLPSMIVGTPGLSPRRGMRRFARERDLLTATRAEIEGFDSTSGNQLVPVAEARLPLELAPDARLYAFRPADGGIEHLLVIVGDPKPHDAVLVRLHSECLTGDILGSLRCDCGDQLSGAIRRLNAEGGILLYLRQEGRGIGLLNKLRAYHLQDEGFDTLEANERLGFEADERLFRPAAQMLKSLGFTDVRLLTNNPDKVAGLEAQGIRVTERVAHAFPPNVHNETYLRTKARRAGHYLSLPEPASKRDKPG